LAIHASLYLRQNLIRDGFHRGFKSRLGSRRLEPIEAAVARRREGDLILQIGEIPDGRIRYVHPVLRGQIEILLQNKICRRQNPREQDVAVGRSNAQ
jgi:hypothetical protein